MSITGQDADKVALYIRVAHSLRGRIADGDWPAGTQLPTFTDLAAQYEVAVVTVRQAVALLVADGLVNTARGRGTFVNEGVQPIRENASLRMVINDRLGMPPNTSIRVLSRTTTESLPAGFGKPTDQAYPEYVTVRKLHLLDGEPLALLNVSVASSIYKRFAPGADEKAKVFRLVLDHGGMHLLRSRIEMTLTYADQDTAALLECPTLSALVRIQTWRVDSTGKLVIATDSYYRGDKFVYTAEEHDVELKNSTALAVPAARTSKMASTKALKPGADKARKSHE